MGGSETAIEEGRGVEKWARAQTQDLPHARQGSVTAHNSGYNVLTSKLFRGYG